MTTAASHEDQVLNQQERESDDCAGCVPVHIVGGCGLFPVPVPGCWRWR